MQALCSDRIAPENDHAPRAYGQDVAALGGEFFFGDVNELNAPLYKSKNF
jgi:hypothetical protein